MEGKKETYYDRVTPGEIKIIKVDAGMMQEIAKQLEELYKNKDFKEELKREEQCINELSKDLFWELFNFGVASYKVKGNKIEKL